MADSKVKRDWVIWKNRIHELDLLDACETYSTPKNLFRTGDSLVYQHYAGRYRTIGEMAFEERRRRRKRNFCHHRRYWSFLSEWNGHTRRIIANFHIPIHFRSKRRSDRSDGVTVVLEFTKKQVAALVLLMVVGVGSTVGYLTYRYESTSRSADYTDEQRVAANQSMAQLVMDKTDDWDEETVVCVVDSAFRPMFTQETDYTVAVYTLDEEAFAAGQAASSSYSMDTLWGYSKSGPSKDKYQSLVKVASVSVIKNEKTGEILSFDLKTVE